jgi:monoamine oxidase
VTLAYAEEARRTEGMTDKELIAEIMKVLRDMYGEKIPEPKHFARTKWLSNPHAKGSYSFPQIGTKMSHFDDLAREVDNKLFFAGEHTSKIYYGNAHAALLSGEREAEKIIKNIFKTH